MYISIARGVDLITFEKGTVLTCEMMIFPRLLSFLCVWLTFTAFSQRIQPFVSIEYSPLTGYVWMHDYTARIGATLNERVFLSAGFGYQHEFYTREGRTTLHYGTTSFAGKVRVLSPTKLISPIVQLTTGFGHTYKGDTVLIDQNGIHKSSAYDAAGIFTRIRRFTSFQVGVDANWKLFSFQLAGGIYYASVPGKGLNGTTQGTFSDYHWTASVNVSYLIHWKKEE